VTALSPSLPENLPFSLTSSASTPLPAPTNALLAGVVERLYREYECCLPLATVIEVVTGCCDDIQATPAPALPELTERLARHRLAQIGHRSWS
jgi:hypothetical protein